MMSRCGVALHGLLVLVLSLFLAVNAHAAPEQSESPEPEATAEQSSESAAPAEAQEEETDGDRYRFLPIPIFVTEPAVGNGLGLALTMFHPVKEGKSDVPRVASLDSISDVGRERQAPPVVTAVAGAYTSSSSWMAGVGHSNNWRNDSIRYNGALGYARINSEIYILALPLGFDMETSIIYQDFKIRLGQSDFMLGAGFTYLDAETQFDFIPDHEDPDNYFNNKFKNIGLSLKASYDTRDNTMSPTKGRYIDLAAWRYDDAIGGDYDYWYGSLKALSFHTFAEKWTWGLRLEGGGIDGGAPFFAVPYVKLRGIPALRYQNKIAGAFETELRYRLAPRWELSAFAGLGYTSDDIPIFENPDSIYNFGMGGRFNIFEAHNVWIGLDIARGPEDWNGYIQVGHPW